MPSEAASDRSPGDEKAKQRLSAVLTKLKKDDKNPDLLIKAAEAYLAWGDLGRALRCGEACLRLDEGRKDAGSLVNKVKKLLGTQEAEASEGGEGEGGEPPRPGSGRGSEEAPSGDSSSFRKPARWVPEEQRPSFKTEQEALATLRRELSPPST